ncbi:MAG: hypothetical protein ACN4GM_06830 [Gammaproteobacteria bacterium]
MRSIKIALSLIAAFALPVLSGTINELSPNSSTNTSTSFLVSVLLLICFTYLHYMLHSYLHPYEVVSKEKKSQLVQATSNYYYKSFFHGAIGLGYVVILMSVMPLFVQNMDIDSFNYLVVAMLFIIFGTASKARGLVLYLLDEQTVKL